MKAKTVSIAATALLLTGCVVREVREIHYVPEKGNRATGAPGCERCEAGAAPGAVMAESQPPPLLVEEALDQPAPGYVWVDGYWHWDGVEWVWVPGNWMPPIAGQVYVPPAYYASGAECLYVPGRWARSDRVRVIPTRRVDDVRDHRTKGKGDRDQRDVRDHRGQGKKPPRDHRGDGAPPTVDRDFGRDMVITVPPRRPRNLQDGQDLRDVQDRTPRGGWADRPGASAGGSVDASAPSHGPSPGASQVIGVDPQADDSDRVRDMVLTAPRPARPEARPDSGSPDRGPRSYSVDPRSMPPRSPPPGAAHSPRGWSRPAGPRAQPDRGAPDRRPDRPAPSRNDRPSSRSDSRADSNDSNKSSSSNRAKPTSPAVREHAPSRGARGNRR
jgi:WXXGXW repeat (2 copies)